MESSDDDCASHNEEIDVPHTEENEVRRGVTIMKTVIHARSKGKRFEVAWNENGQPIEPHGSMLRSFIVDDTHEKYILKVAGKLHRGFRAHLTKYYLRDSEGNINDHPPKNYKHMITEDEWKAFVAKRTDDSFLNLSNANRQRALNPLYPYRKSRMGYARLKEKLLQETGSERSSIGRHILWKAARVNKDGVIDNENVQQVWEQCEKLSESLPQEEIQDIGRRDILAQVLNVPEYAGRVRGMGFGVSQRNYFPPQKRKNPDNERLMDMLNTLVAKVDYLVRKDKEKESENILSDKGSCNLASQSLPEGVSPCQLYLSSPTYRVVGKGSVHNRPGDTIHNTPLPIGYVKVTIEIALESDAPLPVPIDAADIRFMGDAIGTFVAWPMNLVAIDGVIPTKNKRVRRLGVATSQSSLQIRFPQNIKKRVRRLGVATSQSRLQIRFQENLKEMVRRLGLAISQS